MKVIKILRIGILFLCISWIGNLIYFYSQQLAEPIILKHYYELPMSPHYHFELFYITNKNEKSDITFVEFPQLESQELQYVITKPFENEVEQSFSHHKIKTLNFQMSDEETLKEIKEDIVINEIRAYFSNGEVRNYSIGEIILYRDRGRSAFEGHFAGSSNSNEGFDSIVAKEDLIVNDLQFSFLDKLSKGIKLSLNKEEVTIDKETLQLNSFLPKEFKKGEELELHYQFQFGEDDLNRHHFYEIIPRYIGETVNGEPFSDRIHLHYRPYISKKELREIIDTTKDDGE
ncbi:hypothetical protein [Sutcliffiella deserti]|uniref:hypothetical protein n=1 Tax=Sutcliffiella deserti TaxID=2875501 RepID=UPI001CBDAD84|nr:hypothetical protein [Sutcliffiella deserti]